jgi:cyanophycinase
MTTRGHILLEGGAEFSGAMSEPDRSAMALAGGPDARISIIPAAAAPDNNHARAGENGVRWFQKLGSTHVTALPLIDRASAENPAVVTALRQSKLIYLLGGFPRYLHKTLSGTSSWQAIRGAHGNGSVIAGSSAGAMVLCAYYYHPKTEKIIKGLDLVPGACVIPHHDAFGQNWVPELSRQLPDITLIGIDEQTGILNNSPGKAWQVYGKGGVTLYRGKRTPEYHDPDGMFQLIS